MNDIAPIPAGRIARLLRPKSVAIVGASPTPGALGNTLLSNLERAKFAGDIHLINPRRDEIGGRPCLNSIEALPEGVDVAVLAIPRAAVLASVKQLAERGVGGAIIFSAGFAEGGAEGLAEQQEIARVADEAGMVILGPNCLGMINYMSGVELTFVTVPKPRIHSDRKIGIVSQSGAMAVVAATTLMDKGLDISFYVSTGNEAGSTTEDYVAYMIGDTDTQVIAVVAEQLRRPKLFQKLAREARAAGKPIILLHPGRSAAARESAATHTGAMAGDYKVMEALVGRAGVILCADLEEYGDVIELATRYPTLEGGAAILGESGAFKALSLDVAEAAGLELPPFTDENSPLLRAAMPEFVAVSNPVDLTAQALVDPDLYRRTFEALLADDRLGSIIISIIQTDPETVMKKFPYIAAAIDDLKPAKPVIFTGVDEGAIIPADQIAALRALNVAYFPTSDRAFRAVARLTAQAKRDFSAAEATGVAIDLPAAGGVIPEYRAKQLLGPLGFAFPKGRFAATLDEAKAAATEVGYPVVLKAQSADLSHKSDAGGVILNLADEAALVAGWARLFANVASYDSSIRLDGALIEGMGARGHELIVGARNDPDWGPVILVGLGGVMAELFHDVRLLPPDLTKAAIVAELDALKSAPLLRGFRGSPALDVDAVADLIGRVGALLQANPRIREIDINPVVVYPNGAVALDALMLVAPEA
jgi:acyl-CoA synthetase (NDP forming)